VNPVDLVDEVLSISDTPARWRFLDDHALFFDEEVAGLLKQRADHFLRAEIRNSLQIADILYYLAKHNLDPMYEALGLLVEANARSIGLGEYEQAIELYDKAAEIYQMHGRAAEQARSQVGKVNSLSLLGRHAEAIEVGQLISPVLEAHQLWRQLATLTMNLGTVYGRRGEDVESLSMFDRAGELFRQIGFEGTTEWAQIQLNRAVILRNLGRFDESINASQVAVNVLFKLSEDVEAARAQQVTALTYFSQGRFNEALDLLDHVREVFLADGRTRDILRVELYITDCLLQLRRFSDVLEKCQRMRGLFANLGTRQEEALALVNEAVAYAELRRYDESLASLAEAHQAFVTTGNQVEAISIDLEKSAVFLCQERFTESLETAKICIAVFDAHSLPIDKAQALIVAARAALALKQFDQAQGFVNEALGMGDTINIPTVKYQAHSILGLLASEQNDMATAQSEFDLAIREVEQLRGSLMVEFRVSFLEDKETLYQDMVGICIDQGQPLRGLEYAERAKSRALLDLLAYRLDLTIQARNMEDHPLVEELVRLRVERDQLYRQWESDPNGTERGWSSPQLVRQKTQQKVLALEAKITELWHRLLVHNADYARDAALWAVRTESVQPYLDEDTLLVEYYVVHGKLVVFLVTKDGIQAQRLDANLARVETLIQRFQLNLRSVPHNPLERVAALANNARALLEQLYQLLIAPFDDQLAGYPKLIIAPHGPLHYLPFHALHNGAAYMLELHEINYLPSASSLRYCQEARPAAQHRLAIGHSNGGRLPYAVDEARKIATLLNAQFLDEKQATLAKIFEVVPECRVLHLAAHGDFRFDNPLFSGLAFTDGWLTTMDIFNLRLKASLVTLSACQTGRNVVAGGDELLGLMRAFLSAGAASVALTLWAVEDRSTARLMETFYQKMNEGYSKGAALRQAQLQFIQGTDEQSGYYAHPYFWAPFFLVGDAGPL